MTARVLPPPTELDLAVIRARVDGRGWLGYPGVVRWDRVAGLGAVVAAVMLTSLGFHLFSDAVDDTAPAVLGAAVLALVTVCVGGATLLTSRRIDDAVRTGWVASSARPLVQDWRLHHATPPQAWLTGAPPSPATLRESAL